jgi:hypothetical protein
MASSMALWRYTPAMTDSTAQPEAWLRGPLPGIDALLMPAAHALVQAREDIEQLAGTVDPRHVWKRPGGAASIGFHVRHVGGSLDRLLTYARGEALNEGQRAALRAEAGEGETGPPLPEIAGEAMAAIERALIQLRDTPAGHLLEPRKVGRAGLPATVLGLLFHAAEHATRHVGQAITTARILGASDRG